MPNKLKQELWILCQGLKQNCESETFVNVTLFVMPIHCKTLLLESWILKLLLLFILIVSMFDYEDMVIMDCGCWKHQWMLQPFCSGKTEYLPFESNLDYNSPNALKCVGCSIYLETNRYIMEDGWEENSSLIEGFCTILNQNHW